MFLVGLTGGISCGKSYVAQLFKDNDIPVIDGDQIARMIVEPGMAAWKKIKKEFGDEVFHEDGTLNREALGKVIFDNKEKRHILNEITHPIIHRTIYKEVIKYFFEGHNFIVLELPLLFEIGAMLDYIYKIICVTCEEDIQLGRLMERNKLSESDAKKRIQAQMSLDKKCERSHFVIDNSGSLTDTKSQTILIMNMLMESKHHWKMRSVFMATAALLLSGLAWFINRKYKYVGN